MADEVSPTTQNMSSCQPESHPWRSKRKKEVKYTKQRPQWPQTNVRRIAGGAEEWRGCAPSPNDASRSCLWHNIRWLHQAEETVAGFDSWTLRSSG